jgi:hypothetical protein
MLVPPVIKFRRSACQILQPLKRSTLFGAYAEFSGISDGSPSFQLDENSRYRPPVFAKLFLLHVYAIWQDQKEQTPLRLRLIETAGENAVMRQK